MISISKLMPSFFTVMTNHGVVHADGFNQLVKLLEQELDISISNSDIDNDMASFDEKLCDLEQEVTDTRKEFKEFKDKVKEKVTNHDSTRSSI